MVPLISPVDELIDRPLGRPVAEYLSVWPEPESVAWICRLTEVLRLVLWLPGLVTVTVLPPPPPLVTMAWVKSQLPLASLAQVDCMAKVPVVRVRLAAGAPGPWLQAHRSPFSSPDGLVQPPAGFWSVTVSAYSWPLTIETPSRMPALPALMKFSPQDAPASVTYGMLV